MKVLDRNPNAKILVAGYDKLYQTVLLARLSKLGIHLWNGARQGRSQVMIFDSMIKDHENKRQLLETFASENISILMGQIAPLSEGKNLQMCDHLFLLDLPYVFRITLHVRSYWLTLQGANRRSTASGEQIEGRLVRNGQIRPVMIGRFVTQTGADALYAKLLREMVSRTRGAL